MKTRAGRAKPRSLSTRHSMHLVLRSSKAKGKWSFKLKKNETKISQIMDKFSAKYGIKIISMANVGNHLHLQIKLKNRHAYKSFIRAITGAITLAVTGASKNKPLKNMIEGKFWDYRPFTRIVQSFREVLNLRDYIQINKLEGFGYTKSQARFMLLAGRGDSS